MYLPELDNTTISSNDVGQGVIMLDVSPSGKHIATVVRTAPKFVWIWFAVDFKKPILTAVLSHTGSVREIKWNNTGQNLMISFFSVHRDYVSVWNSTVQTPKLLNPDAVDLQLRGIQWIPNHNSVLMWTSDEFMVSPLTEDGAGVNTSIMDIDLNKNFQNDDLDRGGSPQHLQDDNTVVRDLVNGVQQQEWGDPGNYQLEDTFHKMNIKK